MTGREHARNIMLNFFAVPGSQCIDPKKQPETTCIKDNKTLCKINIVQGLLMMYVLLFFQFCFGRLRNATHFLLWLDFLIGVPFSHAEISDVCIYIYMCIYRYIDKAFPEGIIHISIHA